MGPSIFSIFPISILLLFLLLPNVEAVSTAATTTKTSSSTYETYVKNACSSTTYPKDCYKSLSSSASTIQCDPQKLCIAALSVTLKAAQNASAMITSLSKLKGLSPGDSAVIKDCSENLKDSVDELKDSLKALGNLQGPDREFQLANVNTWASAALTDDDSCADDVDDKKLGKLLKKTINKSIQNLERSTSNFLALMKSLSY